MKNIHIIATDKPSRLSILNSGKLNFGAEIMSSSNSNPQHIYITSDEEIKEGDYYIEVLGLPDSYLVHKLSKRWDDEDSFNRRYYKIILTTDQDLINDGVQSIDDEFLEWFVNNPSCEEAMAYPVISHTKLGVNDYKIVILKEEPKQETLEEAAERLFPDSSIQKRIFILGAKWKAERMYSEEEVNLMFDTLKENSIDNVATITNVDLFISSWKRQFKKK